MVALRVDEEVIFFTCSAATAVARGLISPTPDGDVEILLVHTKQSDIYFILLV
tara:strand:- start:654 stop:812 length:159 start_codon:yes stop_codon:yes gene_type:complete